MQKTLCHKEAFKVIGLTARTNNQNESSMKTGKILPTVQAFIHGNLSVKVPARKAPGTLICGYMNYESNYTGDYTYFIGEITSNEITEAPEGLELISIPEQNYVKFTNGPGPMPSVVAESWQKIWAMTPEEQGGKRAYKVDWEIYDERAKDHSAIVLDIYIGLV